MHAVLAISGNQYLVTEGLEFLVHRLPQSEGTLTFTDVMLLIDGDKVEVGQPHLSGVSVVVDVLGEEKGDKVTVLKFKAKSRYHKTTGFRPKFTKLKVTSIGTGTPPPKLTEPLKTPKKVTKAKNTVK